MFLKDVLLHLLHQGLGRLVEVLHHVFEEENQPREVIDLAQLEFLGRLQDLTRLDDVVGGQQQDLLLLHQRQGVEEEQQELMSMLQDSYFLITDALNN